MTQLTESQRQRKRETETERKREEGDTAWQEGDMHLLPYLPAFCSNVLNACSGFDAQAMDDNDKQKVTPLDQQDSEHWLLRQDSSLVLGDWQNTTHMGETGTINHPARE